MTWFWPWVGKIQVNAVDFWFGKYFRQFSCIHADKADIRQIWKFFGVKFFYCPKQDAGISFDSDKVDIRIVLPYLIRSVLFPFRSRSVSDGRLPKTEVQFPRNSFGFLITVKCAWRVSSARGIFLSLICVSLYFGRYTRLYHNMQHMSGQRFADVWESFLFRQRITWTDVKGMLKGAHFWKMWLAFWRKRCIIGIYYCWQEAFYGRYFG